MEYRNSEFFNLLSKRHIEFFLFFFSISWKWLRYIEWVISENPPKTRETPKKAWENPKKMLENPTIVLENPMKIRENPAKMRENPVFPRDSTETIDDWTRKNTTAFRFLKRNFNQGSVPFTSEREPLACFVFLASRSLAPSDLPARSSSTLARSPASRMAPACSPLAR